MNEPMKEWTPDQPLRADATDEQIFERQKGLNLQALRNADVRQPFSEYSTIKVAREFAAACVEAAKLCDCGLTISTGKCRVCDNDE